MLVFDIGILLVLYIIMDLFIMWHCNNINEAGGEFFYLNHYELVSIIKYSIIYLIVEVDKEMYGFHKNAPG